jgi:ABC-type nickel/cobalt efflux system permease component RcnA
MPQKSDILAMASLLGAITARQEQIQWWLSTFAAAVAIVAGLVAIYQKIRPKKE